MSLGAADAEEPRSVGRPRDPDVDRRVLAAAAEIYGESGWDGVSILACARRAGVGRASVYLRWRSRDELLLEALSTSMARLDIPDSGDLRNDLIELARRTFAILCSADGPALLRLYLENGRTDTPIAALQTVITDHANAGLVDIVERGVQRGELPDEIPRRYVVDAVVGAVTNHVLGTPLHARADLPEQQSEYLEGLVDLVLRGARGWQPTRASARRHRRVVRKT